MREQPFPHQFFETSNASRTVRSARTPPYRARQSVKTSGFGQHMFLQNQSSIHPVFRPADHALGRYPDTVLRRASVGVPLRDFDRILKNAGLPRF
jgi:hypothetical protein